MHTEARQRQARWMPPMVGAAGEVRRTWLSAPAIVGLTDSDGAQWGQAPTEQEKKQGYKKTDVLTLQINCNALKVKVDELLANADPAGTDASALAMLKTLAANVTALCGQVAALASGTNSYFAQYPILLVQYNGYAATFASFGIEEAAPPPVPSKGGAPPVVIPPKTLQEAKPGAPTITKKPSTNWDWLLYASGALAVVGVLIGTKVIKL